jgi:nitrite reductase/ring-hydroxylating ferredoxin subunit
MRDGWPYSSHPTGWFQVAWSDEIPVGGVVPLHYFGTDLVAYRGASGELAVLDAYCPHLGAHLGHGGCVTGDDITCPFHGWQWSATGDNTCIPYSATVNRRQKIRSWPVREVDGLVVVWHESTGAPPAYEPPSIASFVPGFDAADFWPVHPYGAHTFPNVRAFPQFVAENIVDAAHFRYVHSARAVSTITHFDTDGPCFYVNHQFDSNRSAELRIRTAGLGLMLGVFYADDRVAFLEIQATTPTEGDHSDLRGSVWARRPAGAGDEPSPETATIIARQHTELGKDIPIWERLRYIERAPFTPEEARPYRALRKWATQFYPEAKVTEDDEGVGGLALVAE